MSKKIIGIVISILIVVSGIFFVVYGQIKKENNEYTVEKIDKYEYFIYKDGEKFGVIDKKGEIIINAKYDEVKIPNPTKAVFVGYSEDGSKVLNEKNEEIYSEYQKVEPLILKNVSSDLIYEKQVLKYEKDGKYGLINIDGKKVTKPIYESIETLKSKEGEMLTKKDGKYGVINQKGYKVIENEYDKIEVDGYFNEETLYKDSGYIVGKKTGEGYRYGYITSKGEKYFECIYNDLQRILEINDAGKIYLLAAENGRYGVFKNKENIIKNEYQSIIYDMTSSVFTVLKGRNFGVIAKDGKELLKCEYQEIDIKGKNIYARTKEGKVEVYSNDGTLTNLDSETMRIEIREKPGYSIEIKNIEGKTIYKIFNGENAIGEEYMYLQYLGNDLLIASKKDGKLGIINLEGQEKVDFIYTSIQKVLDTNIIGLVSGKKVKLANMDGKIISEMENGKIEKQDEFLKIYNSEEVKYFDNKGKEVSNIEVYSNNKLFSVKENGKWGFKDKSGKIIVKCNFDEVTEFNKYGYAGIKKDGKWGVIDEEGKIIEDTKYKINEQTKPDFIGKYYQVQYGFGQRYYTSNNN